MARDRAKASNFLQDYGALLALFILFLINAVTRGGNFLQLENLRNLVSQNAAVGVIAVGMTLVIASGGIDLSVGSLTAMCGAVMILALNKWAGLGDAGAILLAFGAAILVGGAAGLVNGLFVAYGRVAAFIVTLAGLAGYRSIALVLGNGGEIRSQVPALQDFGFGGIPIPFSRSTSGAPVTLYWSALIFVGVAVAVWILLTRTTFGRYATAIGANEEAAHYSGVHVARIRFGVYALLGALVGLAAILAGARMNSVGTGTVGLFYELDAIAAVVIGGTSLRGGRGRVWGTVVGVILLTLISNMITAYRIDTNWQGLVRGVVILAAVLIQRERKRS